MKNALSTLLMIFVAAQSAIGQTVFIGLTPGRSSRTEATRSLGQPTTKVSETLYEYRSPEGQKLYIQSSPSDVIERLEVVFAEPVARTSLGSMMGLPAKAESTKWDSKGRLEEYFGGGKFVVVTHLASEPASPVIRVGYYSSALFAAAMQKPAGTPGPTMASMPASQPASATSDRSASRSFKDVDLLVPKGDRSDEKSVRLLFDRGYLVIDADKGEKIYKNFPYESIVSAEYSYSSSPRWKTAIGAAVLIGVFALPLFFMKGKKHWLTIKTANDFAILHLDKDNYKVILATFETTVGARVDTVKDDK